jgi:hypothetical protein
MLPPQLYAQLAFSTRHAYHADAEAWEYAFAFAPEHFEDEEPPSYILYVEIWKNGRSIGILDLIGRWSFVVARGRTELRLTETHVGGLAPGNLSRTGLNGLAWAMMREADVDSLHIQGGTRTTGCSRGKTPRAIRFPR